MCTMRAARSFKVEIHTADEQIRLAQGDALFINAGQLHMICSSESTMCCRSYAILFAPELIASGDSLIFERYIRPVTDNTKLPFIVFRSSESEHSDILRLIGRIVEIYQDNSSGYELALRNCLSELWLELVRKLDSFPLHLSSRQNRQSQFRLKQMLSFIRQNYMRHITLDDIAAAALVSKSECLRCFRRRFEMTPIQYLIQCRLELAHHLLISTELSIKEVASRCGFEDAGYFGRIFRSRTGMTPAAYRKHNCADAI